MSSKFDIVAAEGGLRAFGELDHEAAPRLLAAFSDPAVNTFRPVLLDMAEVTFVDSGGLRALMHLTVEHRVVIQHPSREFRQMLAMSGTSQLFRLEA